MQPTLLLSLVLLGSLLFLSRKWLWTKALALSLLLLALSVWWLIDRLSGNGIDAATLYHLQTGLQGAGIGDFSGIIAGFAALALLSFSPLAVAAWKTRARKPVRPLGWSGTAASVAFLATFLAAVAASPLPNESRRLYRQLQPADASSVAAEYHFPATPLRRPRNIVWLYGESLERTYLDPDVFPGLMPNLERLAGEGLDFRDIGSPEGTGWTIAGIVASMCGVPLTTSSGDENSMGRMDSFLPGAHCLGDYLKRQGYTSRFIGGADASFAAKGRFLSSHGFDEVRDMAYFQDKGVAPQHFSSWGVHDDVLLDDAFDSFMELSAKGSPFLLTALTMDTHHPAGHLPVACRDVRYESRHGDIGLLHALSCTDRLVHRFVERIRNSPYAADTLIVIASDHLAMPNDLSHVLKGMHRENLLLFLGPDVAPRQVIAGTGTTLDSGATLLQLIDPAVDSIGFGRSLLATRALPSASASAVRGDDGYRRYLGYARRLWTGDDIRTLRIDGSRLLVGVQQVKPPVLLEYDADWELQSIHLEDATRQFKLNRPENVLAYVDRCIAFDEDIRHGEWCAMLVDRNENLKLYADFELRQGVPVDAPLAPTRQSRPSPRQPVTVGRESRMLAGDYQIRIRADAFPSSPFWVEAVSSQGDVVHALERVDASQMRGRRPLIRLPVGLDAAVDDLEIRVWLNRPDEVKIDTVATVRTGGSRRS